MKVVFENELELEDVFDIKNVLSERGLSNEKVNKETKKMLKLFWISPRYIKYTMPWMFFPYAASTIRKFKRMGYDIEIHTSRNNICNKGMTGKIERVLMYFQYWLNGCFIAPNKFFCYLDDKKKIDGVCSHSPDVVFEDKPKLIEYLNNKEIKCICVSGVHNKQICAGKNINILSNYRYEAVEKAIKQLLGNKKYELYKTMAKSDILYKRLLKFKFIVKAYFRPIILNKQRLIKRDDISIIYVSNHRSTLDPLIITSIINEPVRYVALARFFNGEDSIFNNNKNIILRKITAWMFKKLKFFR